MTTDRSSDFDADGIHLATAAYGLPPRTTTDAMTRVVADWSRGRVDPASFQTDVAAARESYARLVGVEPSWVATGPQAAPMVGLVAASVPDGAEVLVAAGDFSSLSWPFGVHDDRGVRAVEVPLDVLADRIGPGTGLVALSSVQFASGAVADLDAIEAAAARHGVDVLVDTTQAAGWLPTDASRFAYTVTSAYKWLLSPRGTAFLTVRPDRWQRIRPLFANFAAGTDIANDMSHLPPRLAPDARRFNVSPAWFSWVGTRTSLAYLESVGVDALREHALTVASAFAAAVDLDVPASAIVSLDVDDADEVDELLAAHDVSVTWRAGRLRLAFHVYNTVEQATAVGALLRGRVRA